MKIKGNYLVVVRNGDVLEHFTITIPKEKKIKDYIRQKYDHDVKILEIDKIPPCDGCIEGALGQKYHMGHPNGCLHYYNNCDECWE